MILGADDSRAFALRTGLRAGLFVAVILSCAACGDSGGDDAAGSSATASAARAADGADASADGDDTADAGPFVSHGPYPAPHPAPPQIRTFGGPTLSHARLVPVFFPNETIEGQLTQFITEFAASSSFDEQVAEYGGVGAFVEKAAHPTAVLPAAIVTDAIETWLRKELDDPHTTLPAPDGRTVYLLYMPLGINVVFPGGLADGCDDFNGYHADLLWHGQDVAYAVFPRCDEYTDMPLLDELTEATSHEIVEAVTDPFPYTSPAYDFVDPLDAFWPQLVGGNEIADLCTLLPDAFGFDVGIPYIAQRSWSNASANAGHDPCLPALPGPYFASVPELPDVATYGDGFGDTLKTKAVKIPIGGTRTVTLDLFSDAPTDGPWTVTALDDSSEHGGAQVLDFRFDRAQGGNGDKIAMTITVLQASESQVEGFWVYSTLGTRATVWLGAVVNQ